MTQKMLAGLALGLALAALAPVAHADPTKNDNSYGYTFTDDILNAGIEGATGVRVVGRPRATRETLLRPRTHFVTEMLKSVENM